MTQYDNTNSGALFKNDKRATPNHPDYKGSINIEGKEYWLSSWIKVGKSGDKFMSLSAKPKESASSKPAPAQSKGQQGSGFDDMGDDCPF